MTHQQRLDGHRAQIETWLNECFQEREPRGDLYDAMYYSLLAGGKRIRPVLVLETCRMCGGDPAAALPFAGAVEMIGALGIDTSSWKNGYDPDHNYG